MWTPSILINKANKTDIREASCKKIMILFFKAIAYAFGECGHLQMKIKALNLKDDIDSSILFKSFF